MRLTSILSQPVNVGFSYSSQNVHNLATSTTDMYNFMRLFFHSYPKAAKLDFFIAGESYGGTWVPTLAHRIVSTQESTMALVAQAGRSTPALPKIRLKGVLLGNVVINDIHQWKGFYPTACGGSGLLNKALCAQMAAAMPRCESMLRTCRNADFDMYICGSVLQFCRENSFFLLFAQHPKINMYNFEEDCEGDASLCYKADDTATQYLNTRDIKRKLGVPSEIKFSFCNMDINNDFTAIGDTNRGSEPELSYLLENGLDVLIYVGSSDWTCNAAGMEFMINELPWKGMVPFRQTAMVEWAVKLKPDENTDQNVVTSIQDREKAYLTKIGRGKSFGQLTFLEIPHAGHMVPKDRPAESLEMINDWLRGEINWIV
jgi:cathepsin A (carboxypeptidase C)